MERNVIIKKFLTLSFIIFLATQDVFAIEETASKRTFFDFFKREKNEVKLEKPKKENKNQNWD